MDSIMVKLDLKTTRNHAIYPILVGFCVTTMAVDNVPSIYTLRCPRVFWSYISLEFIVYWSYISLAVFFVMTVAVRTLSLSSETLYT